MITNYVVGFAFDRFGAVALINKTKPAWQKGKWNGVGGKIELSDQTPAHAMAREFFEETGMRSEPGDWRHVGRIIEKDCAVQIFTMQTNILYVRSTTEERVEVFRENEQYMLGGNQFPCIPNIPVFLEMCKLKPDSRGNIPFFTLDYTYDTRS